MVRSFLPVGQGAFYCECFSGRGYNVNIVYDCGSLPNVRIVEQEIKYNFQRGEKVEALFISHLDEDHINGIPFLLKYCEVKRIYFPLISSENREIMKIYYSINNIGGFTYNFLENPRRAIEDLDIDYELELITISELGQEEPNQLDTNGRRSGEDIFEDIKNSLKFNFELIGGKWLYIPFNFRQQKRKEKLMDVLEIQFGRKITEEELIRLWRKAAPSDQDKIKKAYQGVPGDFNTNSMTLFSGEINYGFKQLNSRCCEKHCFRCYDYKPSGCLYTGDYDASGKCKWAELKKAYEKYWEHIGCVQIPHHGSKYSFNEEFTEMNTFFIISAGYRNQHHHPHASVVKSFLLKRIIPYIVTEQIGSAVFFMIK